MPVVAPLEPPAFDGEVQPLAALLLYEIEGRVLGTLHPLTATRRGQAAIGAGRPFTHRDLQNLLSQLAGQARRSEIAVVPPEVVARGAEFTVWWRPARVEPMWFLLHGQRFGLRVPWPPLVLVASNQCLWCAALADDARPDADAALYHAPLMNVDAQGQVCLGTADAPPDGTIESRAAWEAVVCETNFAHVNHRHTLQIDGATDIGTERHFAFWQALHAQARFPTAALVPRQVTLQRWLEEVLA
jgi:PRTRC genetic system protein B